jgi:hypothetical protein
VSALLGKNRHFDGNSTQNTSCVEPASCGVCVRTELCNRCRVLTNVFSVTLDSRSLHKTECMYCLAFMLLIFFFFTEKQRENVSYNNVK